MKIALAQIDARLGDIDGICSRIENQAHLAIEQKADVLCTPAPLFTGLDPGGLIESADFEHTVLSSLRALSGRLSTFDLTCLIPVVISYQGSPLFELFMLKDGRLIPMRSMLAQRRDTDGPDAWAPPVFDIAGVRIATTFDLARDITELPTGCDLLICFGTDAFDASDEATSGVASVADGHIRPAAVENSVWLALIAPIGGFDEAVYTGGSFVMDDFGRVVAAAPCFEEALLIQEVAHGRSLPALEDHELSHYQREEWIWGALRLSVRDAVRASGFQRAAITLSGDLASTLLAVLCADALGPRNVVALLAMREQAATPEQDAAERERAAAIRSLAHRLHIRLVERSVSDPTLWLDRDVSGAAVAAGELEGLLLGDVSREESALAVSALTKTDAALAASLHATRFEGMIAPFGDVCLTQLEFLARERNRLAATVPSVLVNLRSVRTSIAEITSWMMLESPERPEYRDRMAQVLSELDPQEIDGVVQAHVDCNLAFEEIPLARRHPEAVALLLMFIRRGEAARRMLPMVPIISARSFTERSWPRSLAWSDLGRGGEDPLKTEEIAQEEIARFKSHGAEYGDRMRGEIMGLLGGLFGLSSEQVEELRSENGQRRMRENLQQLESQMRDALNDLKDTDEPEDETEEQHPSEWGSSEGESRGFPFFSQN